MVEKAMKGKVSYVASTGGIKFENNAMQWYNPIGEAREQYDSSIVGKEVIITCNEKNQFTSLVLAQQESSKDAMMRGIPVSTAAGKAFMGADEAPTYEQEKQSRIIRQACIKAAAKMCTVNISDATINNDLEKVLYVASTFEKFCLYGWQEDEGGKR